MDFTLSHPIVPIRIEYYDTANGPRLWISGDHWQTVNFLDAVRRYADAVGDREVRDGRREFNPEVTRKVIAESWAPYGYEWPTWDVEERYGKARLREILTNELNIHVQKCYPGDLLSRPHWAGPEKPEYAHARLTASPRL